VSVWQRVRPHLAYVLFLAAVALVGGYAMYVGARITYAYRFLKSDHLGFRGRVHRADPQLGFAAVPGARGEHVFPIGPPLPMHYSVDEFRVSAADPGAPPRKRPFVLALGCSFTYGDACIAEETYSLLVAQGLGGTALNAGKCAYGLAQMLALARRLVPQYRPEYVIVQFSPWLPGRGTSGSGRSTFGDVPVPYLTLSADGRVGLEPPLSQSRVFALPIADYDNKRSGAGEYVSFALRAGIPLFWHDDLDAMSRWFWRLRHRDVEDARQRAVAQQEELNRRVYAEIADICTRSGSQMVILRLSHPLERHYQQLKELQGRALIVDAQATLDAQVPEATTEAYYKRFGHWRGDPPVLVDTHPNPAAHRIIADEVLRRIRP
jgi:hypothetical protein